MEPHLLTFDGTYWVWHGGKETRFVAKDAGFRWTCLVENKWATDDTLTAVALIDHASPEDQAILRPWKERLDSQQFLTYEDGHFIWLGPIYTKDVPKQAGFRWTSLVENRWATADAVAAKLLRDYADEAAREAMSVVDEDIEKSKSMDYDGDLSIPVPEGLHPVTGEPFAYRGWPGGSSGRLGRSLYRDSDSQPPQRDFPDSQRPAPGDMAQLFPVWDSVLQR